MHPLPGIRAVQSLHPNAVGTCVLCIDSSHAAFLYSPAGKRAEDAFLRLPDFPTATPPTTNDEGHLHVLWDLVDRHVMLVWDAATTQLHAYVYAASTMTGPAVAKVGPLEIVSGEGDVTIQPVAYDLSAGVPVLSHRGRMVCAGRKKVRSALAPCYPRLDADSSSSSDADAPAVIEARFKQYLALLCLADARQLARRLDDRACWLALSSKAIEVLDLATAIWVYHSFGDAGMVLGLETIQHVEDRNLLAGHVALLFGRYEQAERLFLASSRPAAAVDMRRDLLQPQLALKLAHAVAPHDVPEVAMQYARQLELQDADYEGALRVYEMVEQKLLGGGDDLSQPPRPTQEALALSRGGQARCTLRIGHVRKGVALALESCEGNPHLLVECARILEGTKATWPEAAALYEKVGKDEHAARLYIQIKALAQAAPLLAQVAVPKLHALYAKACEEQGNVPGAIAAYEQAHDGDSVIRLCLREDPAKAFHLVRETASATAALLAAKHCVAVGDVGHCLEFMLLAQQDDEAFEVAKAHHALETYAQLLLAQRRDVQHVLEFYRQSRAWAAAGQLHVRLGQPVEALPLLLQGGALGDAIQLVVEAQDPSLTGAAVAFLNDGPGQDWGHLQQLYARLGNYEDVVRVALARADREQAQDKYVEARAMVHEATRQLEPHVRVWAPLQARFVVLHSYLLVKSLLHHERHDLAARLLLRVAKHAASCFPRQQVRLFTSVVLQCQRVGLSQPAYDYASLLVADPQAHQELDPKIRRKVETIVRRHTASAGTEDDTDAAREEEATSPCPFCNTPVHVTQLQCPGPHKAAIPMCVVSGRHMERDDWSVCPNSGLPALYSEYVKYMEAEGENEHGVLDPVCGQPLQKQQLVRLAPAEVAVALARYTHI